MKTRISSKGQVVIPKAYRQKLGWATGTELIVEEEAGQVLLKSPLMTHKKLPLSAAAGMLHRPGRKAITLEEMDTAIDDALNEKWAKKLR